MITRIVKLYFLPDKVVEFNDLFIAVKNKIAGFEGCIHLELWRDVNEKNVYFTYSIWESERHLNQYRFSELFKDTWQKTKILFSQKPEARSLETMIKVK